MFTNKISEQFGLMVDLGSLSEVHSILSSCGLVSKTTYNNETVPIWRDICITRVYAARAMFMHRLEA